MSAAPDPRSGLQEAWVLKQDAVVETITALLAEVGELDPSTITPRSQFTDFGLDSVEIMEVVAQVEAHYGLTIPPEELGGISTLRELARYVVRQA